MSKVTLKALINNSSMSEKLVIATVKQFGGIIVVKQVCQDVSNHGIDAGFGGFFYCTDTVKFAENNLKDIITFGRKMASELGTTLQEMLEGFKCLNGCDVILALVDKDHEDRTQVMNALAWFMGEELCRTASDMMEG
jgi:hypothetical protein